MSSKKLFASIFFLFFSVFFFCDSVYSYEIFIYRPHLKKDSLNEQQKITLHGEFFGHLLFPSTFPSYNDISGPEDRFNFGFQNLIFLTRSTTLLAQLVTHDDGHRRTKFDWHFSLRQLLFENLVVIIGHDSNHDSDYQSLRNGRVFFVNRNYAGLGLPITAGNFYVEPFTWFFHHTNQRGHIDLSGEKIRQEYGLRIGVWLREQAVVNFQILSRTQTLFSLGQALIADMIVRIRLLEYLELSVGAGLLKDIQESPLGNQKIFYKFMWGIAVPF